MKKRIAMITALTIAIGCWPSEAVVMAEETGNENRYTDYFIEQPQSDFEVEEEKIIEEGSNTEKSRKEDKENTDLFETIGADGNKSVVSVMKNLHIPQKLDIVIDPWEMDGRGQIYSETYVIKNEGDTAGTLILSNLACKPDKSSKVIVRPDTDRLHDNKQRALYMEMWFGENDRIVMSEQEAEYRAQLNPGEELTVRFAGEVNENASEGWENVDVRVVPVVYSWDVEKTPTDAVSDDKESAGVEEKIIKREEISGDIDMGDEASDSDNDSNSPEEIDVPGEIEGSSGESKEAEESEENINEMKEAPEDEEIDVEEDAADLDSDSKTSKEEDEPGKIEEAGEENIFHISKEELIKDENVKKAKEEEIIKVVELLEMRETKAVVDFLKVKADHQITSAQFIIRNSGEKTGILSLKNIVCLPKEGSGIAVKAVREEVQDGDGKAVFMELVPGKGEKIALSQTGSEYQIELKPGEDMVIQFDGVMNEEMFGEWEEECIAIDAACSWDVIE